MDIMSKDSNMFAITGSCKLLYSLSSSIDGDDLNAAKSLLELGADVKSGITS